MPYLTLNVNQASILSLTGYLSVSDSRRAAIHENGEDMPHPIEVEIIVDTGATHSCIDFRLAAQLGLTQTGIVEIRSVTSGGKVVCPEYDVSVQIPNPGHAPWTLDTMSVVATDLGEDIPVVILGMDALSQCMLVVDGQNMRFSLAY